MIAPRRYSGSAYEVGRARAEALGSLSVPEVGRDEIRFARACRDAAVDLDPLLDELYQGFLDGGGWDPDRFLVYYYARRQGVLRGCTNFAVLGPATATGETLVGRNYDWVYSDRAYCEARAIDIPGAKGFVSYTHHWIGHPDCLNASGLFVAISSLPAFEPTEPGVQWNLLVDVVAARCATVEEAVTLLTGARHLRGMTYLLADPENAAAVEATGDGVTVRRPESGILVATNHAVGSTDDSDRTRHSVARYDRARDLLLEARPGITEEDALTVLRDPVCTIREGKRYLHPLDHVPLASLENWGTIWSTLCRPAARDILVAPGHPGDVSHERVAWRAKQSAAGPDTD